MREERDSVEREFKLNWPISVTQSSVLQLVRPLIPSSFMLVRGDARMIADLYLDCADDPLLRRGATLRLRRRRSGKWRANFKPPTAGHFEHMHRREVRTNLSRDEVFGALGGGNGGLAFQLAREYMQGILNVPIFGDAFELRLALFSARHFYAVAMRARNPQPFPGLLYVVFDEVVGFRLSESDCEDVITSGCLDYTEARKLVSFREMELEVPAYRRDSADTGMALATQLRESLLRMGCESINETKYQIAARLLMQPTSTTLSL